MIKSTTCQTYNIIKAYCSQAVSPHALHMRHSILTCLIDPSIDWMLAMQTIPWPEAIYQPLKKTVERSLPSLI